MVFSFLVKLFGIGLRSPYGIHFSHLDYIIQLSPSEDEHTLCKLLSLDILPLSPHYRSYYHSLSLIIIIIIITTNYFWTSCLLHSALLNLLH